MATWRRKALEAFPHMRREIQDPEISLYGLFPRLVDEVWKAHDANDHALLQRIHGYAEWALNHPSKELWNPAAVSFYEHLFLARKDRTDWEKALSLIPIKVVRDVWGLWDYFLTAEETADILTILKKLGKPFTPPERERPGNEDQRKRDAERRIPKGGRWFERA
jgi:hypothetical protein